MAEWSGGSIHCSLLLLLLLLPTLTLVAQDDCSHNCKIEANRYYYVRPEGSAETLCPAQPCLTPSQLREHFSECERNNSCQTANTSLVLLQGTYTFDSGSFVPPLKFLSFTGYNEDCNTESNALGTPSIDCNCTWISLMIQYIRCLHVRNCIVFTGPDADITVDRVTFYDSLIRLASIATANHSELDYNYTLGSQSYCFLQKQLADVSALVPSNSVLALRKVSFFSDHHTACTREYGIQLATIHATDSALHITDCYFTQNAITHISLLRSTLLTSGVVQFENANTAIIVNSSTIALAGEVNFFNNNISAILALGTHSTILLAGTVEFTNNTNTADSGGAVSMTGGSIAIVGTVNFNNNSAFMGGAIASNNVIAIAGLVQFINNSAFQGGGIDSDGAVTIADNAQVIFQGNHANRSGGGGAIFSSQCVTIAGSVHFINNSASLGGAIFSIGNVTITDNAVVALQDNHAQFSGGAIFSFQHVTIAGTVQFVNNSAYRNGAIYSFTNVNIAENAQVILQSNHATHIGGAIGSGQYVSIAGSVQFINNSANQGGAIDSDGNVTIASSAHVGFPDNHAKTLGGAISHGSLYIAGTVQFINNSADLGGAINSGGNVTIVSNTQVVFQGNHAERFGGAINSIQVTIAGTVLFNNNIAYQGGAIMCTGNVTIGDNAQVVFQHNQASSAGGAIISFQHVTIADNANVVFHCNRAKILGGAIYSSQHVAISGSVQFTNNSAYLGGAISSGENVTIGNNAQVVFQGNNADSLGGAISIHSNVVLAGSVQFISNTAQLGGAISMFPGHITVANNAKVLFEGNHAYHVGGAIYSSASSIVYSVLYSGTCALSFGSNSKMDLFHNTAERGGSAIYGITMSKLACKISSPGDYIGFLPHSITVILDSFSAVSSDPLRVCICPDQSTPDCLAILPDQNIPHLQYNVYPGQNFTIPAVVVGLNFALTSGSVYAQFLTSNASLGSDSQYVQGVIQTGCSQLQYSVLSDKKQEMLVLTSEGRDVKVADMDSSTIKEDIRIQNNNSVTLYNYTTFSNPNKYYVNNTFVTNLTDSVFRLAGYVQKPLETTPVFVSVQLFDCPPGFTLTGQKRCDCDERVLTNLLTCNITDQTVRRHGSIWVNATFTGNTIQVMELSSTNTVHLTTANLNS